MQPDNQIRDRPRRYYSIGPDGFEEHVTADEARRYADDYLGEAREEAIDKFEWPDWVEGIEWGELICRGKATETNHEVNENGQETSDYELKEPENG